MKPISNGIQHEQISVWCAECDARRVVSQNRKGDSGSAETEITCVTCGAPIARLEGELEIRYAGSENREDSKTLRAWCPEANAMEPSFLEYFLDTKGPSTGLVCYHCFSILTTFYGHIEIGRSDEVRRAA